MCRLLTSSVPGTLNFDHRQMQNVRGRSWAEVSRVSRDAVDILRPLRAGRDGGRTDPEVTSSSVPRVPRSSSVGIPTRGTPRNPRNPRGTDTMIDIHHHLLPGVDDGPREMDEAAAMCRMAADEGIEAIVATPHVLR